MGRKVFCGLSNLPIAVDQCGRERRINFRPAEWREGQNGASTDVRLVRARIQDDRQSTLVADGTQRGDGGFANERIGCSCTEFAQHRYDVLVDGLLLTRRPRRRFDHCCVGVAEQRKHRYVRVGCCKGGRSLTNGCDLVLECPSQVVVGERLHASKCAECELTVDGVDLRQRLTRGVLVALMAGDDQVSPTLLAAHLFSMFVRVMTSAAVPKPIMVATTAPTQTARTLPATTAHSRRHQGDRRASGALTSDTSTPAGAEEGRRARAGSAVALAGLRHPAAIKATMARPAIQPAAVVISVILTQEEMVPELAPPVRAPRTNHRWWAVPMAVLGVALAAAPVALSFVPSSVFIKEPRCREYDPSTPGACLERTSEAMEFALVPADAEPVEPRMSITGAPTFDTSGQVYFVTITQPNISMVDWFVTRDNDATRFMSYRDKYGDQTQAQLIQAGQRQMRSAKDNAMYVALKAAGFPVEIKPGDVIIDFLLCLEANEDGTECVKFSPADELLDPGDVLKKVNDTEVTIIDDLPAALEGVKPGEMIDVEFERAGEEMSGQIETILSPGEDPPRTIIGFRPIDTTTVALPEGLDVEIDTESIGGPSAGLAFTLTLIDELTEGDLMGGERVAVTGTIDVEGNVGAIGGLNSKASAVQQVGVKYFLVPTSQDQQGPQDTIAAARRVVGDDVEIIPVATVEEALAALERIGGDPVKLVNPPTAADS